MARTIVDVDDDLLAILASEADHDSVSIDNALRRAVRLYVAGERADENRERR